MSKNFSIDMIMRYLVFVERVLIILSPLFALYLIPLILVQTFVDNFSIALGLILFLAPFGVVTILAVTYALILWKKKVEIVNYCFDNESLTDEQRSIFKTALNQLILDNDWFPVNDYYDGVIKLLLTEKNEICDELFYKHFDEIVRDVKDNINNKAKEKSEETNISQNEEEQFLGLESKYSKYKTPENMKNYSDSLNRSIKAINKKYFIFSFKYSLFAAMLIAFIFSLLEIFPCIPLESSKLLRDYIFNGSAVGLLGAELIFNVKDFFFAGEMRKIFN